MSMVRAKVNANIHEWRRGDVITVERTRMVDGLITRQYLTVLEADVPDFAPDSPEGLEAARIAQVAAGDVQTWTSDQPPIRPTYRRSENDAGATDFGDPLPADGGVSSGKFIVPDELPPAADVPDRVAVPADIVAALTPTAGAAAARAELSADTVAVPPRSGKGSGVAVWREFLQGQGIDTLPDGMTGTKEDLLALWDAEVKRRGL